MWQTRNAFGRLIYVIQILSILIGLITIPLPVAQANSTAIQTEIQMYEYEHEVTGLNWICNDTGRCFGTMLADARINLHRDTFPTVTPLVAYLVLVAPDEAPLVCSAPWGEIVDTITNRHPIIVLYDEALSAWVILNMYGDAMPLGARFRIQVESIEPIAADYVY